MKFVNYNGKQGYVMNIEGLVDYVGHDMMEVIEHFYNENENDKNEEIESLKEDRDYNERTSDERATIIVDAITELSKIVLELKSGTRMNRSKLTEKLAEITDNMLNY